MKTRAPFVEGGGWKTPYSFNRRLYGLLAILGLVLCIAAAVLFFGLPQLRNMHLAWLCAPLVVGELFLIAQAIRYDSAEKQELEKAKAPPPYHVRNLY